MDLVHDPETVKEGGRHYKSVQLVNRSVQSEEVSRVGEPVKSVPDKYPEPTLVPFDTFPSEVRVRQCEGWELCDRRPTDG